MLEHQEQLPSLEILTNGIVLELYDFLVVSKRLNLKYVVGVVKKVTNCEQAQDKNVSAYIRSLVSTRDKKRNYTKQGEKTLSELCTEEFQVIRKRKLKEPDTPKKKRLRESLDEHKRELKEIRKTAASTQRSLQLEEDRRQTTQIKIHLLTQETEELRKEKDVLSTKVDILSTKVEDLSEGNAELQQLLANLEKKYHEVQTDLQELNKQFEPLSHDVECYKKKYNEASNKLEEVEKAYSKAKEKLGKFNVRNVNKRIKRKEEKIGNLETRCAQFDELRDRWMEELQDCKLKLSEAQKQINNLTQNVSKQKIRSKRKINKIHDMKKKLDSMPHTIMDADFSLPDIMKLQKRVEVLSRKNDELEKLVELLQDDEIRTYENGKYTDEIRETIMELLSMNVAMTKVAEIIRVVIRKLSKREIGRLPSLATISTLALEARHLADLEVADAMKRGDPAGVLGNCIHGDGTTKYHRKYQNFQCTLPDGTQKTFALTEMGSGDTDAVFKAFEHRMKELAEALSSAGEGDTDEIYNELITNIKSTMTDQGPTMPQFSSRVSTVRSELLPEVVKNWETLPEDVRKSLSEFGTFFCRMHPLINFAEEVNKVLKSYEDIATDCKLGNTVVSGEAGVTRLVRTVSKGFHHRGSDKCGVEDSFTSYLHHKFNEKNHLCDYIGNRANILFEGAASVYFHRRHILHFIHMLPEPNLLLQAIECDINNTVHLSELRALGIFSKLITEPLWHIVKNAKNILDLNDTLYELQLSLLQLKDDSTRLLTGKKVLQNAPVIEDVIYDSLFKEHEVDPESEALCVQAMELISCAVLLILERQCKDQLPGGKYWQTSTSFQERYENVPTTNLVGERDFAQLDLLIRTKPAARTVTLESLVMWCNNKTPQWLESLPAETKTAYMASARSCSGKILEKYQNRKAEIKAEIWRALQEKEKKQKAKEERSVQTTLALVQQVTALGGVWITADQVDQKYENLCSTENSETVRRALHSQLQFIQRILKCKGPSKEHFQLSTQGRQFTKEELHSHLKEVVVFNNLQSNANQDTEDLAARAQTQEEKTQQSAEEMLDSYTRQKQRMLLKIDGEKKKRAADNSKALLEQFTKDPNHLVDKNIEHLFIVAGNKRWFAGRVLRIVQNKTNPLHTIYSVDYDEEDEEEHYPLLADLKKGELIILE